MSNGVLYTICVFIWGSTWLAIKLQLGVVAPEVSVFYRFSIASVLLLAYCWWKGLKLSFDWQTQLFLMLQGLFIFTLGYWCTYWGAEFLTSGLLAVICSMIVFLNIINGAIFLGAPIHASVVFGAVLGVMGICLVFWPELAGVQVNSDEIKGIVLGTLGALCTSLGNIVAARNFQRKLPVIPATALSMSYGSLFMLIVVLITDKSFLFDTRLAYMGSLVYLAVFGSIITFGCYFLLVGRIGADRASYIGLVVPIIALELSHIFENYRWSAYSLLGVALVMVGNYWAMRNKKQPVRELEKVILDAR